MSLSWCRGNIRQVIFAARYGAHLGNYMMHCHNIVHEDKDMLRAFLVRRYRCCDPPWASHVAQHSPGMDCGFTAPHEFAVLATSPA